MRVVAAVPRPDQTRSGNCLDQRPLVRFAEKRIAPAGDDQRRDPHGPRRGGQIGAADLFENGRQRAAGIAEASCARPARNACGTPGWQACHQS